MGLSSFLHDRPSARGLTWLALSDTAVIQSPTFTDDDGGASSSAWTARGTVSCRIYPVSVRALGRQIGGAVSEQSTHYVVTPAGTEVGLADRVVLPTRGTYEVTVVLERSDALTTVFEVFRVS